MDKLFLKTETDKLLFFSRSELEELKKELEMFLEKNEHMNNRIFSKNVMFTHELKANNNVEGYNDDVTVIEKVIENAKQVSDKSKRDRIINLYNGYRYILRDHEITEENISELFKILSKDLIIPDELKDMNEMGYRQREVMILQRGRLDDSKDYGMDYNLIPDFINCYIEYVNNNEKFDTFTDYFLKSQIMHFYFVYIHPYFDLNGRTSRTIAMWYLLNNKIYPYIIFNRGINYDSDYDRLINYGKKTYNITNFLRYMLITVKKELEKEYIMHNLGEMSDRNWSSVDYQTIENFLSMNGQKTLLDYAQMYNYHNDKKRSGVIFDTMIVPLIEDGTLDIVRETKKFIDSDRKNMVLTISKKRLSEIDDSLISRIKL